jgi:hypothetical protein
VAHLIYLRYRGCALVSGLRSDTIMFFDLGYAHIKDSMVACCKSVRTMESLLACSELC